MSVKWNKNLIGKDIVDKNRISKDVENTFSNRE